MNYFKTVTVLSNLCCFCRFSLKGLPVETLALIMGYECISNLRSQRKMINAEAVAMRMY